MAGKETELPPEQKSVVRELVCWQLLLALVTGGFFFYTIYEPVRLPNVTPKTTISPGDESGIDPELDSQKLFEKIAAEQVSQLYAEKKLDDAHQMAMGIANDIDRRRDLIKVIAAGNVLSLSDVPREVWKGFCLLESANYMAPKSMWVKLNYARQLFKRGKIRKSEEQYEEILKASKPDWLMPRRELADIYLMDDKTAAAIKLYTELLEAQPDDPRLMKRLGLAMFMNGDSEGFDTFLKGCALEQDNRDWEPEIKALIDNSAGLIESAISSVREDVEANPDDIKRRIKLARLLISVNRLKDAKKNLVEARKKRETESEIHEVLADCLNRMGNKDGARAEFETTARLIPLSKPAAPIEDYMTTQEDMEEERKIEEAIIEKRDAERLEKEAKAAEEAARKAEEEEAAAEEAAEEEPAEE